MGDPRNHNPHNPYETVDRCSPALAKMRQWTKAQVIIPVTCAPLIAPLGMAMHPARPRYPRPVRTPTHDPVSATAQFRCASQVRAFSALWIRLDPPAQQERSISPSSLPSRLLVDAPISATSEEISQLPACAATRQVQMLENCAHEAQRRAAIMRLSHA